MREIQELRQLKTTEVKQLRHRLLTEQGGRCPLCGNVITEPCLDHQHKRRKTGPAGPDGAGLVRGVLCRDCNALEGRIWNAMTRHRQPKTVQDRIRWLQNLISYYNKPASGIIYPGEAPRQRLSRRNFNTLKKAYAADHPKAKPLTYPRSGYITKTLVPLYEHYGINPYND